MIYLFTVCCKSNHNTEKADVLIEYVFNSSADGSVIKQQSIKLSWIFIMYFLSFFHFPNQKFISASSLSVCLQPQGGGEGFEVCLSLAGQRKRAPRLHDPPKPPPYLHPAVPAGGGREAPPSWVPISCLLFHDATQLGGLARLFPSSILIPPLTEISIRPHLQQILQPLTSLISTSLMSGVWCNHRSVDFITAAREDGAEEEVLFGSD